MNGEGLRHQRNIRCREIGVSLVKNLKRAGELRITGTALIASDTVP